MAPAPSSPPSTAFVAGLSAYLIWGFIPLVFQMLGSMGVGPWETLAHRTFWAIPVAGLFVWMAGHGPQALSVFTRPRVLGLLALSSLLIAVNWLVFIWAVNNERVLQTSLGYFINPLLSMAAGALFFRERLDRIAQGAIALAAVGVVFQAVAIGGLPWVSLTLAASFCGYGIVRKQVAADAQTGLFIECLILGIPGAIFAIWLAQAGGDHFTNGLTPAAWLIFSGAATAIPLVLFAWAARRLPLSAMGFMQFLAPSMTFVLGVVQGEPLGWAKIAAFAFIWAGAGVFAYGLWRASRRLAAAA
ncbi:EamA family transporter RarD [Phenylobacterium sp.]|uniref:EamA family transporter RarD n=1 Tax=Phenylobacterium sp. TaxID=1871053 RepID=UPI002730D62F|nr:EamA family transporter RarD [Phenylobacterium sp.]MDP1875636.1 EamA family transporter RarD [Phenylobacterium sp.]MDP3299787.1 EamA family transporter RarD [Phenylobacterium sp.]